MRLLLVLLAACGSDPQTPSDATNGAHDATLVDATPPVAAGCITDVSAGDHTFTCGGLQTDVRIPAACEAPGCGLILELHGDTGNGLLMDGHTNLRADPWDKIWNNPLCLRLRKPQKPLAECEACEHLQLCGGGCPIEAEHQKLFCREVASGG